MMDDLFKTKSRTLKFENIVKQDKSLSMFYPFTQISVNVSFITIFITIKSCAIKCVIMPVIKQYFIY